MAPMLDATLEAPEARAMGTGGRRVLRPRRDPRLRGHNRTVQVEVDDRAYEVLSLHSLKIGRKKGEILTGLILDHLPSYVIQERGGPVLGSPVASWESPANSPAESEAVATQPEPAGGKEPEQGSGKAKPKGGAAA